MTGYRNTGYLRAVARLKPGVPFGQARAEIAAIGDRLSRTHAEDDGRGATLVTIREQLAGSIERPLLVLAGLWRSCLRSHVRTWRAWSSAEAPHADAISRCGARSARAACGSSVSS